MAYLSMSDSKVVLVIFQSVRGACRIQTDDKIQKPFCVCFRHPIHPDTIKFFGFERSGFHFLLIVRMALPRRSDKKQGCQPKPSTLPMKLSEPLYSELPNRLTNFPWPWHAKRPLIVRGTWHFPKLQNCNTSNANCC